jgi:hypothetical protein
MLSMKPSSQVAFLVAYGPIALYSAKLHSEHGFVGGSRATLFLRGPRGTQRANGIARSVNAKVGFYREPPGLAGHLPDSCPSEEQPGISADGIELAFE